MSTAYTAYTAVPEAEAAVESPRRRAPVAGISSAFGTFGELLQGVLGDGTDFLVTLPIARWSTATFVADPDEPGIRSRPAHKHKAIRLTRALLSRVGYRGGGTLTLESTIPEGKGMASSSADLVATARAVGNAMGIATPPEVIEELLRPIEPSDGVMYGAVTAFEHRKVRLRMKYEHSLPPLTVIGLDEGGTIDTLAYNRRPKPFGPVERREYEQLLADFGTALANSDPAAIGRIATRSAELNQLLLPKRGFTALRDAAAEIDALGVVVAHSGPVIGLLLSHDDPRHDAKRDAALRACKALSGGVSIERTLSFYR